MIATKRRWGLALLALAVGGLAALGQATGNLDAGQQKQIDELNKAQETAGLAGRFDEAHQKAPQTLELREKWQGPTHWQTIDARGTVEMWQRRTKIPAERRADVARARQLLDESHELEKAHKLPEAEGKRREALALFQKALGEDHPDTALGYIWVGASLSRQGKYPLAEKVREKALAIRQKTLGFNHADTAASHTALADALDGQARHVEAQKHREKGLAIREKVLGERHPSTLDARNNLAYTLNAQGKFLQAQKVFEKALQARRELLGEKHSATADSYNGLGVNLRNQGKNAEALPHFRNALEIRLAVLGEKNAVTAASYTTLATCLGSLRRYEEAQPLFAKALAIRIELVGEKHPFVAQGYNVLAENLVNQGKRVEAQPLLEKSLALYTATLGPTHPDTGFVLESLAENLENRARYTQALPFREKALTARRKAYGDRHFFTARSFATLASNQAKQGQFSLAQPLFEKALAIRIDVYGEENAVTARSYLNLASNLGDMGKLAQAQPLYEKALAIFRGVAGEIDLETARAYNNLAVNLDKQGKFALARPLLEKALAITRELLPPDHTELAYRYNNLGFNLNGQRKYAEAHEFFEKALAIRKKALGEEHPDTAFSYNNLAFNLRSMGKYTDAQPLYEMSLVLKRKTQGEEHPSTAQGYDSAAANLRRLEKYPAARVYHEKALAIRKKALGDDHPDTVQSINGLALTRIAEGELAEAVLLWQSSLPGQEAARFHLAGSGFDRAVASAGSVSPHSALAAGLAHLGQSFNAFRHAEAGLARGLLDDLAPGAAARELPALSATLTDLDTDLIPLLGRSDLSADETRARDEGTARRRAVTSRIARLAAEASAAQVLSLESIQAQLPADAALIFWLDVDRHMIPLGCVLRREGPPRWFPLPGTGKDGRWTDADRDLPGQFHRASSDPNSTDAERERLVTALRQQRLTPLREGLAARGKLPAARQMFVVPAGPMAYAPVEVLAPEYRVSYIPSGSVLARTLRDHRPLAGEGLLALGDPTFTTAEVIPPSPPAQGLLLSAVVPGGVGARAGLLPGDVLIEWGRRKLARITDLQTAQEGGADRVRYWREGKELTTTGSLPPGKLGVTIDPLPAPQAVKRWRQRTTSVVLRGTGHRPLPGTGHEVNAVASLVKGAVKLLGSDASEQTLDGMLAAKKLKGYRLLHLATHGEVDEIDPDHSRLILAQDRLPDPVRLGAREKAYTGELTVRTVRETWELDADLVVLSACQTALGKKANGDGLLGFAHAFLARGARSVVLSRWKVEDGATALLMIRFYENVLGRRKGIRVMGRAAALQEAKDWLRKLPRDEAERRVAGLTGGVLRGSEVEVPAIAEGKRPVLPAGDRPFAHPFYWAAFVLVGDPD